MREAPAVALPPGLAARARRTERDAERVPEELPAEPPEALPEDPQRRVAVHLQQPRLVILIEEEVCAEQLERVAQRAEAERGGQRGGGGEDAAGGEEELREGAGLGGGSGGGVARVERREELCGG